MFARPYPSRPPSSSQPRRLPETSVWGVRVRYDVSRSPQGRAHESGRLTCRTQRKVRHMDNSCSSMLRGDARQSAIARSSS
eukprot:1399699-Prymnesium_polylepis.1